MLISIFNEFAEFYYIAPELRKQSFEPFLGFTDDDLNDFPERIQLHPEEEYTSLQLGDGTFIRTKFVSEIIMKFAMEKIPTKQTAKENCRPLRVRN